MPFIRLRGWLAYYIWPSYAQRMFILEVKRDIRSLVPGGANRQDDKRSRPGG